MARNFDVLAAHPYSAGSQEIEYYEGFQKQLERLRPTLESQERYFLTGHYRYRDIIAALGAFVTQLSLVTFIRHPVERTLSDYFYSLSEAHPDSDQFSREFPTLESYAENAGQMNKQLMYLAPDAEATVDETISAVEDNFAFVGITEQYQECEKKIFSQLSLVQLEPVHKNKSLHSKKKEEYLEIHCEMLSDLHRDEIKLYEYFRSKDTVIKL